ncbi:unnamed protein product [Trichobilharzia szidati]|nr:unnamed protein product [Trichobilharzia szidati]
MLLHTYRFVFSKLQWLINLLCFLKIFLCRIEGSAKTDIQKSMKILTMQRKCLKSMAHYLGYGDDISRASYLDVAKSSLDRIQNHMNHGRNYTRDAEYLYSVTMNVHSFFEKQFQKESCMDELN